MSPAWSSAIWLGVVLFAVVLNGGMARADSMNGSSGHLVFWARGATLRGSSSGDIHRMHASGDHLPVRELDEPSKLAMQAYVDQVVSDLNSFWKLEPKDEDRSTPAHRRVSVRWETGQQDAVCGSTIVVTDSAAYCPANQVVYLSGLLFERLWLLHETAAIVTILAHEFGHHIQEGFDYTLDPPLFMELQADCLAGVYVRSRDSRGQLTVSEFESSIRLLESGGDSIGTSFYDLRAHGTGLVRSQSFRLGFRTSDCTPGALALIPTVDSLPSQPGSQAEPCGIL